MISDDLRKRLMAPKVAILTDLLKEIGVQDAVHIGYELGEPTFAIIEGDTAWCMTWDRHTQNKLKFMTACGCCIHYSDDDKKYQDSFISVARRVRNIVIHAGFPGDWFPEWEECYAKNVRMDPNEIPEDQQLPQVASLHPDLWENYTVAMREYRAKQKRIAR
jgi:hypothetical protein